MSTPTPPHASPVEIQSLLLEFDASGQSAAAFARSRGIPTWKIYHALNRRRGRSRSRAAVRAASTPALVPVHVVERQRADPVPSLELFLASGQRIRIGADFDAGLLRRVVEALGAC